ncbi:MAG: metal ABC transporter substrate-binding protein [Ruminococcus sp.]
MSKIKKILSIFLCIVMSFSFFACSKKQNENENNTSKLSIICTIFPEYDWVKNIICDGINGIELTLLLDNGIDLHNYQPTVDDLVNISKCDMFVYVGGESDKWVEDALANAENKDMVVVNLLDILGASVKEEEVKEGMQAEEEHADTDEETEYDEHVWLSLKNTILFCNTLSEKLQSLDAENASVYKSNTENYVKSLYDLDNQYKTVCDKAKTKTIIFGDRFPFRYLVDDYGLDYYAAFVGCSAETEASFETISFLAQKVDQLKLNTVLTIEGSDQKIAETIISNTKSKNQKILSLNSMQGVTSDDVKNGMTYLSIMTDNLSTLDKALS